MSTPAPAKLALVVTGGTITALAADPFEVLDYGQAGALTAADLLARAPGLAGDAEIVPVDFAALPSFDIYHPEWRRLLRLLHELHAAHPDLSGIVLTHGTGALEETAFMLSLVWDLPIPLALTGAQRPASALGSDGWMNLAQALRLVQQADATKLGVTVIANGEIHLATDVVKTSNLGLDTFMSPELGPVGLFAGLQPRLLRLPATRGSLQGRFPGALDRVLPRVDIVYCHSGGDAVAIEAFIAAGARGIVLAGFAPGYATSVQAKRLADWIEEENGIVVHSSRAFGLSVHNSRNAGHGFLPSGRFPPAKARLLLQLGLQARLARKEIGDLFAEH
ncbi:MAG: L-asparaginase [Pelagibacterium sp. SCN 64-44]|nr:MAG: L-asparaginase [Pelagibacterium sp. SCN 64-44]